MAKDPVSVPQPAGALALAYLAAQAQWSSAPVALPEFFATTGDSALAGADGAPVDVPSFARTLQRWTGLPVWTTAFASTGAARLALLCAIDEFHHRYGTGRRVVLVPASRATELARPIAVARYRCVAVAEMSAGVPQSSALSKALDVYGRDIAAVWQTQLGDPKTLERRQQQWQPLMGMGVKFVVEGASLEWTLGRVPLSVLGIDGAILPFPDTFGRLGPRGVATGASPSLAEFLPIPPNAGALTDRNTSPRFLSAAQALIEGHSPKAYLTTTAPTRRSGPRGKTVDEPLAKTEDTDRA